MVHLSSAETSSKSSSFRPREALRPDPRRKMLRACPESPSIIGQRLSSWQSGGVPRNSGFSNSMERAGKRSPRMRSSADRKRNVRQRTNGCSGRRDAPPLSRGGLQILGDAWSEPTLIEIAYAYEQLPKHRRAARAVPLAGPARGVAPPTGYPQNTRLSIIIITCDGDPWP